MTKEEAIETLTSKDVHNSDKMLEALDMAIKSLEQEPKIGHWIPMGLVDANDNRNYECSECHHGDTHAKTQIVPYCWYCGSKMESEDKEYDT